MIDPGHPGLVLSQVVPSGPKSGPNWAQLGPKLALGALLAAPKAAFVEKLIFDDSTAFFVSFFDVLGLLGGSWTGLSGAWVALGPT